MKHLNSFNESYPKREDRRRIQKKFTDLEISTIMDLIHDFTQDNNIYKSDDDMNHSNPSQGPIYDIVEVEDKTGFDAIVFRMLIGLNINNRYHDRGDESILKNLNELSHRIDKLLGRKSCHIHSKIYYGPNRAQGDNIYNFTALIISYDNIAGKYKLKNYH